MLEDLLAITGFGPCISADFPLPSCQLSHTSPHSISQPRRPALTGSVKGKHSTNTNRYLQHSSLATIPDTFTTDHRLYT
jgi:hypothetical protein